MIEILVSTAGEIVSLDEAKRDLGVWDDSDDHRVSTNLAAARAYCERWSQTTLRLDAVRELKLSRWPVAGCVLRWPPVVSVDSITYRDTEDIEQTLSPAAYRVHVTAQGRGLIEWARDTAGFSLPDLRLREDAITIRYRTGWQTAGDAPADAKSAIMLIARTIYGEDEPRDLRYAKEAAMHLLSTHAQPTYA